MGKKSRNRASRAEQSNASVLNPPIVIEPDGTRPFPAETPDGTRSHVLEDSRMAYITSTTMFFTEHQVTWSRFNALVVVHGILLAGLGTLLPRPESILLTQMLCLVGLLLSVIWWNSVTLCHDALDYWFYTALEIEQAFDGRVRTLQEARDFRRGRPIHRPLADRTLKRSWITRYLTTRRLSYLTVLVFSCIYLSIAIYLYISEYLTTR